MHKIETLHVVTHFGVDAAMVMSILTEAGYEARVAGGAVRDALMCYAPKDIDIATTAHPEVVALIFKARGYSVVPTGIEHGTVTVIMHGSSIEVTTLRVDTNADGRWAEVEYTDDWKLDAARRDFTMNAMYVDTEGNVHDYFNGQEHLRRQEIHFVGDARERIKEDYLRIMRFYRFMVRFNGNCDDDTRVAIRELKDGLDKISGERIWAELTKIISYRRPVILQTMKDDGILDQIGFDDFDTEEADAVMELTDNPVTILASGATQKYKAMDHLLADRFHTSAAERDLCEFLIKHRPHRIHMDQYREMVAARKVPLDWAIELAALHKRPKTMNELERWDIPKFPVRGADLIPLGYKGRQLGDMLELLKSFWIGSKYTLTREELLEHIVEKA